MVEQSKATGLGSEAVLSFNSKVYKSQRILKAFDQSLEELGEVFSAYLEDQNITIKPEYNPKTRSRSYRSLFLDGVKCEKLEPNSKGWQKGRLKLNIQLEFIPGLVAENDARNSEAQCEEHGTSELDKFR